MDLLVVEDSLGTAKLLEVLLSRVCTTQRFRVVDHAEAWPIFEAERPRVVMLDLIAPDNGWAMLDKIRRSRRPRTPVVILSGSGGEETVAEAFAAGANAYFVKPLSISRCEEILRAIVDHWLGPNARHPHDDP